jgi:hypothetical protein
MRTLLTMLSAVAVAGLSGQALADEPRLTAPLEAPAGGLQQTHQTELTCTACVAAEVTGITAFGVSYLGGVGLWLAAEHEIANTSSGAWVAGLIVPMLQVADLGGLVPVAGPALEALFVFDQNPRLQRLAWIDAGVQAAGMTVALMGALSQNEWQKKHHLTVLPMAGSGASGLAAFGTF